MEIALGTGVLLGLSAGFSPGPLTSLVITQSLRHGFREGFKTSLAPFVTDVPIIAASLGFLYYLGNAKTILAAISVIGGIFLLFLAYESLSNTGLELEKSTEATGSLYKGSMANFLNPNPYLFWTTLGAPTVLEAWTHGFVHAFAFLVAFYGCLIGAKILMAITAAKSRDLLSGPAYIWIMRILGASLILFAIVLFKDAFAVLAAYF